MRAQTVESEQDEMVIGSAAPTPAPMVHRTLPSTVGTPATTPRRYQPPPGDHMPRKTMPQIYDRPRILAYWYVPAAALVAIAVAFSVIWIVGQFTGDDSEQAGEPTSAATTSAGGGINTAQPTTSTNTVVPSTASPSPSTGAGKFKGNDAVLVSGTAPDCLNVRVKAGRENDAIVCVKDGTELTISGGPETANELTWWKVKTDLGEGWAAEDYLTKKP